MNPILTKIIEQYLNGELSKEDTLAFEERMNQNLELQREVQNQREIHEAAKRAWQREQIQKIGKSYHIKRNFWRGGLTTLIVAIVATATWFGLQNSNTNSEILSDEVRAELNEKAFLDDLDIQYFTIPKEGAVVMSQKGILISVPEKAFLLNGKPYKGRLTVQLQEALDSKEIIRAGLSTTSNGNLLETGGMLGIAGYTMDGEVLEFNPKVGVYVQVPAKDDNPDMRLYTGEKNADGTYNWVNPQDLEKIPASIPMSKLDFYPTGYEDFLNEKKWKKSKASRDSLYLSLENPETESDCEPSIEDYTPNMDISEEQMQRLFLGEPIEFMDDSVSTSAMECVDEAAPNYILPSKVLAFWNDQFNNTNLATREFERRMRAIHGTCDNSVLDIYVNNLDKPISYCDKKVVAMGYFEFEKYASENVGKINSKNPHFKQLQKFYEKSVDQLKERNNQLQQQEINRREKHDDDTRKSRTNEKKRTISREAQALHNEYEFNIQNVKKQLSSSRGFTIKHGGGVVLNIDAQVDLASKARKSTTIVDPTNGETVEIKYNDLTFEVANPGKYIKLYAYVMPYELNSYVRINPKKGKFSYSLNNGMRYNLAVVGVKEDSYDYFQKQNFKEGDLGTVVMQNVSKVKLDASVEQLNRNRGSKPMSISKDLNWLGKEQADYKEQKYRENMAAFRRELKCVAFPCYFSRTAQGNQQQASTSSEVQLGLDQKSQTRNPAFNAATVDDTTPKRRGWRLVPGTRQIEEGAK